MESNSKTTITKDPAGNKLRVARTFNAPLKQVWDAWTKSTLLDQWWAPKPWKAKTKSMDFREGGSWIYAMMGPEGEVHWAIATYKTIQPQKSFTGLDSFSDENGNVNTDMPQSEWDVTFNDKGNTTLVEFLISYTDMAQLQATIDMGFKEGMTSAMENLDEVLMWMKK